MPQTYLVFVWHMHQPFYKDLATGEYQLPWTRMHALKDYFGMVEILEDFPEVKQTFNLVPSMIEQIEEYASGKAKDKFFRCALKPAEELTQDEQAFILKYFFQADPSRVIYRYPRYAELYESCRGSNCNPDKFRRGPGVKGMRDLQVLSQLAWFDEIWLERDPEIKALATKGRDFTSADQALMGSKQQAILAGVMPAYRRMVTKGQIELSFTPFYHPILPLLCDSNVASAAHPGVTLPRRFRYPDDARSQIASAREYARAHLGVEPKGMWPPEGSVSDEALAIAADCGVEWMATDNGVLGATLNCLAGVQETYRPYLWKQNGRQMQLIFRDRFLSDLIGFVYSRMDAHAAARHFIERIRENCHGIHASGKDAVVPVILDGENAWEHYDRNGRPFLCELYRLIENEPGMSAVTVNEALEKVPAVEIQRIHPGSWINANFDVWIGAEEDNRAWELLLEARETYDLAVNNPAGAALSEERKKLAWEELMIAEGSDWCWWYGPEHHSENRPEFDKLFRDHLATVYRALGLAPPEALSRPILKVAVPAFVEKPSGLIHPVVEGAVSSYFEWLGAGVFRPDRGHGVMHGGLSALREVRFGSDGEHLFVRLDFEQIAPGSMAGTEVRVTVKSARTDLEMRFLLGHKTAELTAALDDAGMPVQLSAECAYLNIFEMSAELSSLGAKAAEFLRLQVSVWREGLPLEAAPAVGFLEFVPADPVEWG